jgi:predicted metal-dependent peptidase
MSGLDHSEPQSVSLAAARFKALLLAPYMASALTAMTFIDAPGSGTIGIDRRFRVYVDPVVLDRWSTGELAGVLLHEANHVLRDHHQRQVRSGFAEEHFNIAADLEINDDLFRAGIDLPGGALVAAMFDLPDHAIAEWYASHIQAEEIDAKRPSCGSGAGGRREHYELEADDTGTPGIDSSGVARIRDNVASQVVSHPGTVPGGLERWARAHLQPKVAWTQILLAGIHRALPHGSGQQQHSWARPRRHNPTNALLPSLRAIHLHVAVIIDSSGSMTADHLDQVVSDLAALRRSPRIHRISVVSCDTEANEMELPRVGASVALTGGGGTSLGVGLEHVEGLRPRPDLVVVFTDGWTDWPTSAPVRLAPVIAIIPEGGKSGPAWMTTLTRTLAMNDNARSPVRNSLDALSGTDQRSEVR